MRSPGALALALALLAGALAPAAPLGAQTPDPTAPAVAGPVLPAPAGSAETFGEAMETRRPRRGGGDEVRHHHAAHHRRVPHGDPVLGAAFYKEIHLPHGPTFDVAGIHFDMSPTKHVVFLLLAATLTALTLILTARAHTRHHHAIGRPRGFAAGMEALVLYLREEVVMKNIPHGGARYAPFVLTLFFFILFANLLGLIPYGSTATGNISVTAMLALITLVVVEVAGMRAQGAGYLKTVFYWPSDMPLAMKLPMTLIMTPIEIVGKLTKPFALAIRLFANMTAGHIVVLALVGLIFTFANIASGAPLLMAVAIMVLELFVSFLQAFIFALLSAVFIGQMTEAHH